MASSVPPPGAPPQRPSISGYPIQQRPNPDNSLPDAVQNLYVTPRPTTSPAGIPNSMPHPPPPAGARPPPPSFSPAMPFSGSFNNPAISAAPHGIPPPPAANLGYARPVVAPPPFGGANLAAMGNRPTGAPPAAMGQSAFPRPAVSGPPGASPFSSTTNPGSRPSSMPPMMSNGQQPAYMPPPPGTRPSAPMPGQPIQSSSSMMQTPPPAIGVRPTAGSPPGMQPPPPPSMFPTQPPPPPSTSSNLGAPSLSLYGSQQMQPPPLYGSQPPPPLTGSSPYGFQPWQSQSATRVPMVSATPQQRPYGSGPAPTQPLPLNAPGMGHPPGGPGVMGMNRTGPESPLAGASRIDPNQMPRPIPSSSVVVFETRVNNQANLPPSATSDFVVKDTGNCSPRYMRCTMNQIPCTSDLLSTSNLPLALMVQPMALPHPSEEPIQVVDFGEGGPVRCSRCKGYINPFMRFIEQGRRFICNLCGFTDETPRDYCCNLGPDGRRRDADERPELCRGTVEFVATKEYMVRDAMPPVYFFVVDVSMNAVQTGATAAACSAITQVINDLPEGPSTLVGIATYDSTIHFYHLKRSLQQPVMLIVPDVEDVYTPLETDLIVQLSECRQHLEQLLESIPTMFQTNKVSESAFGAAIKGAFLAMKSTGGKLLMFQSVLPSAGIGSLSVREAEGRTNVTAGEKEAHKLLRPADKIFKTMAIEFAEYQVCVDIFVTTQTYVDIASISVVPRTTGGQVYYYFPFSAVSDSAKLYNDLRWNITRPQGFEAVMRVRCSQGLQVQEYYGNFCKRIPTDIDLPAIDCDKTIMVTFKHDDKFQEGSECAFQCALLYTTIYGQRRIRVTTLSLPCTTMLNNLFKTADLDSQFTCFLKQAANDVPTSPLPQVRDQVMNLSINVLYAYRKFCATVSSAGQLILPEGLKLLPLYTLALLKSAGLRVDGRIDDRSYWISRVSSLSTSLMVPLVYPRMLAIHNLNTKADMDQDAADTSIPPSLPLSSEHVTDDGVFLLENGEEGLIYIGNTVATDILQKLFGVSSVNNLSNQFLLQQFENDLSKKLNVVVNEIRSQRCSYLRFQLCRKGEPSGHMFFSYMVEDKTSTGLSYVEFLIHIHRQIQSKMS